MNRTNHSSLRAIGASLILATLIAGIVSEVPGQSKAIREQRLKLGGYYTLGLYANEQGSSREIELSKEEDGFSAWFGVASDSL